MAAVNQRKRPAPARNNRMLQKTKEALDKFYTPFNKYLATVLENDIFLWRN
jgi:hypothetical protein